jgi:predicted RNA binding protein YcfA (HicA-like mRNA interferase family)
VSQIEKIIAKFKIRPESLSYSDICKVLSFLGCEEINAKGSHVKWKHRQLSVDIIIPVHNNECNDFYKKQIRKLLDSILNLL